MNDSGTIPDYAWESSLNVSKKIPCDNCTEPDPCFPFNESYQPNEVTVPLFGYSTQILMVVTTTANVMVIMVLAQKHMRNASNIILIAISLSDTITMLIPAPYFFYMYTLSRYTIPLESTIMCYLWTVTTDVLPTLFHTASIWLTLALAAQRYIHVCHVSMSKMLTNVFVINTVIAIFILSLLHQCLRFFDHTYYSGGEGISCSVCLADWVLEFGVDKYFKIYFWSRVILVHLGPCIMLVVLNYLLYRTVRHAQMIRRRLMQSSHKRSSGSSREAKNHTTAMLIIIVTIFLVTEVPLALITLLTILQSEGMFTIIENYHIKTIITFSNFFILCTYPLNFGLYCSMSQEFRRTFKKLIFGEKKPNISEHTETTCENIL